MTAERDFVIRNAAEYLAGRLSHQDDVLFRRHLKRLWHLDTYSRTNHLLYVCAETGLDLVEVAKRLADHDSGE